MLVAAGKPGIGEEEEYIGFGLEEKAGQGNTYRQYEGWVLSWGEKKPGDGFQGV